MSSFEKGLSDPYAVKSGDTLGDIAKRCGRSVAELQRLNSLRNPNKIKAGQTLYLSEQSAYGVSAIFLDALRHPLANLPYRLIFDDKTISGKTTPFGMTSHQTTRNDRSSVEVWIQNADQQWQKLKSTKSGTGNKLITIVSPYVVVKGRTESHPAGLPPVADEPKKTQAMRQNAQPPAPKAPAGSPSKNNPRVKTQPKRAPGGQPVIEVGIEFPQALMNYFQAYTGEGILDAHWKDAARKIDCEVAIIKAIAHVESKGNAFWRLNNGDGAYIPAILYERHIFSRLTGGKFDKEHPDVSWPVGYRKRSQLGQPDKKMSDGTIDADDIYSSYATSYLRLLNAFDLDSDAAIMACSWGKFQILGSNHALCGERQIASFIKKMCTSEVDQVDLLAGFIQNKPQVWKDSNNRNLGKEISLWDAVKAKNWRAIAFNYNGPAYATHHYDSQLEAAYEKFKK
jgi:murein DD-endopeptidase MepM/ murein hydrolase activator NlpD